MVQPVAGYANHVGRCQPISSLICRKWWCFVVYKSSCIQDDQNAGNQILLSLVLTTLSLLSVEMHFKWVSQKIFSSKYCWWDSPVGLSTDSSAVILVFISNDHSPWKKAELNRKKCILGGFSKQSLSWYFFNQEMKECFCLLFDSPMLFIVLWKREKKIRWLKHNIPF